MKHSEARLKEQFSELESNIHLRQECALDLLHVLGSIEETDNEGHEAVQNTTSQRGGNLPGLTPSGFDTRLTSVAYNDGKYGTITLFRVTRENGWPNKVRPEAAMGGVPKMVLQKFGDGIKGLSKTTFSMPQDEIWEAASNGKSGYGMHESQGRILHGIMGVLGHSELKRP
jgi:hypothetical protein